MDIVNLVTSIFSGSLVEIILKLVLGALVVGGVVWLISWIQKQKNEQAHNETEKDRSDQQSQIDDKNKEIFDDAAKSEQGIEDIINGRKG